MHDAPSFLFITIQLGSFSLSCDILRISLIYMRSQHLNIATVNS